MLAVFSFLIALAVRWRAIPFGGAARDPAAGGYRPPPARAAAQSRAADLGFWVFEAR